MTARCSVSRGSMRDRCLRLKSTGAVATTFIPLYFLLLIQLASFQQTSAEQLTCPSTPNLGVCTLSAGSNEMVCTQLSCVISPITYRGSSDSAADSSLLLTHEKFGSSRLPDNETTSDSDDDDTSLDSAEMGYPPASLVKLGFWIAQGGSRVTWSDFTLEASAGGGLLIDTDHSKPPLTPLNLVVDGQMTMENMIIYVDFDEFDWSNDALCGELTEDTSLKIASSPPAIHVAFLQSGNITYINTIFLPMQEPDELPHCKFSGSFDGGEVQSIVSSMSGRADITFIELLDDLYFLPDESGSAIEIKTNVTITAPKGTHADVEAPLFSPGDVLFKILDRGRLTLRRIKLEHLPPSATDLYPLGMLTSTPWIFSFDRMGESSNCMEGLCLHLDDCNISIPYYEALYLGTVAQGISRGQNLTALWGDLSPYSTIQIVNNGVDQQGPRLKVARLAGAGAQPTWLYENVLILVDEAPNAGNPGFTLIAELLAVDTLYPLPLTVFGTTKEYNASELPLSIFSTPSLDVAIDSEVLVPRTTRLILYENAILKAGPVQMVDTNSSLQFIGDPYNPATRVLDLNGYTTVMNEGRVVIAEGAQIVLSCMTLKNVQTVRTLNNRRLFEKQRSYSRKLMDGDSDDPDNKGGASDKDLALPSPRRSPSSIIRSPPGDPSRPPPLPPPPPPPRGIEEVLGNFVSLLWLFNIDRAVEVEENRTESLVLKHVTVLLPHDELEVLGEISIGMKLSFNIAVEAKKLLEVAFAKSKLSSPRASGSRRALRQSEPVAINFDTFVWFGITGENVTFLADPSDPQPDNRLVVAGPSPPSSTPTFSPAGNNHPPPVTKKSPPPSPCSDCVGGTNYKSAPPPGESSVMEAWEIGVIVAGSLGFAALIAAAVICGVPYFKRRRHDAYELKNNKQTDSWMSSTDFGLSPNSGEGKCAATPVAPTTVDSSQMTGTTHMGTTIIPASSARIETGELMSQLFREDDLGEEPNTNRQAHPNEAQPTSGSSSVDSVAIQGVVAASRAGGGAAPFPMHAAAGGVSGAQANLRLAMQRQLDALADHGGEEELQWEVHSQLGKGAYGVVYKGTWRGLEVAVKRVIFQLLRGAEGDSSRQTALQEAAINATLNHPNIVTTYSYDMKPLDQSEETISAKTGRLKGGGLRDWQLYIIQEYCDAGSMFDAIDQKRYWDAENERCKLDEVLRIAGHVASGMSYIHSRNIIHGDLKPDNVLLKYQTKVYEGNAVVECAAKVADFGMSAKMQGNQTHISGVHHGTPLYIAPEILQSGKASKSADVYSFGIIMWELYFGTNAWDHLVNTAGKLPTGRSACYFPGLFCFEDCVIPAYAALGKECISSNPLERPSFEALVLAFNVIRQAPDPTLVDPISMQRCLSKAPRAEEADPTPARIEIPEAKVVP